MPHCGKATTSGMFLEVVAFLQAFNWSDAATANANAVYQSEGVVSNVPKGLNTAGNLPFRDNP